VRIPEAQEKLGLGEGALSIALLGAAVGALASMVVAGWLATRLGSRPVVGVCAVLLCLSLAPLALAPGLAILVAALVFAGASNGALDVSMNAQAVAVEERYGRPIMSSFHAAFSLGGLAGAAGGGLVAAGGVGIEPHLLGVSVLGLVPVYFLYRTLLPAEADRGGEMEPAFVRPTRALVGLGAISFCVLLGEGAMSDWSAVYLKDTLGTGPGFAAAGYAAFSLAMAAGRLSGDALISRFGAANLVRVCGALAALGLGVSLLVGHPLLSLVGFACAGVGFSVVFPAALSAAGRSEEMPTGPALAAVSTSGYFGFLVGPPVIGFIAEGFGLGAGLFVVVALSAAIVLLAGAVGRKGAKG
jgi:predicted MFS family arabinose efflux permease